MKIRNPCKFLVVRIGTPGTHTTQNLYTGYFAECVSMPMHNSYKRECHWLFRFFFLHGLQHVCKESAEQARNFVWHVYYFAYFQDFFFLKRTILMPRQRQAISKYWMACVLRRWLIRFFSFCIAYDTYAKTGPSHLKILNGMCARALTYQIFFIFFLVA